MELNPVFINEIRQSPFRRRPILSIAVWAAAAFVLMWMAQASDAATQLFWIPLLALPFLVPSFAAGAFAKEYDQQTWQDLYLTNLTNFQVVMGKFWAAMLQTAFPLLALMPALGLILTRSAMHVSDGSSPDTELALIGLPMVVIFMLIFAVKFVFLTGLYVLIGMVCSRYSTTRRSALIWNYAVMFLFTLCSSLIWQLIASGYNSTMVTPGRLLTGTFLPVGFMESSHLLFCSVAGLGSCFLLWVSLSEQRGYQERQTGDSGRGWRSAEQRISEAASDG